MRLRFVHHVDETMILICEGSVMPEVGQRLRATGSQGNGFLVVAVLAHDELPGRTELGPQSFGLRLKRNEIPWPPDTLIEVIDQ